MNGERIIVPKLLIELQKLYQMEAIDTIKKNDLVLKIQSLLRNDQAMETIKCDFIFLKRINYDNCIDKVITNCLDLIRQMEEN